MIDSTSRDFQCRFSPHLFEPIRIEIGLNLIAREMWKIYPIQSYEKVTEVVKNRFVSLKTDLEIRHFWNQVNNYTLGLWNKNTIKPLTSKKYVWKAIDNFDTSEIKLDWDFEGRLAAQNLTVNELSDYLNQNRDIQETQKNYTRKSGFNSNGRILDRIIVNKSKYGLSVNDGHGRLVDAVLSDKKQIGTYLGEETDICEHDNWVSTEYIQRLILDRSYGHLAHLLKSSHNAMIEFKYYLPISDKLKSRIISNIQILDYSYSFHSLMNKLMIRF